MQTFLGIESSCDESSIALYSKAKGLLDLKVYSQQVHSKYGGVVPELAAREHSVKLLPLLQSSLNDTGLGLTDIDGIAYTQGPGLPGALLCGAAFAQSLAWSLNIPAIGVHHMEGHLLSPLIDQNITLQFPFLCLLVSGGHTLIAKVHAIGNYEILGQSIDDAIGEAFDKTAKLLGLGYPGGAALETLAKQGNPMRFELPRPMTKKRTLDMSFSGLKTHVRNLWFTQEKTEKNKADLAASFQLAITDTLQIKIRLLLEQHASKQLICAGGVAANKSIAKAISDTCNNFGCQAIFPPQHLCGDNAAMIAYAGSIRISNGQTTPNHFDVKPRWSLA